MFISTLLVSLLTVVELNCENMFDCTHDSLKNDREYLPTSERKWDSHRYWNKITNISKEIIASAQRVTGSYSYVLPDIVVLCEVENDSVMTRLTHRSPLRNAGYDYVMTHSGDSRGIDVAMLYQPSTFQLLRSLSFRVPSSVDHGPTRDILYTSGRINGGDTLHLYLVHLPSRIGGEIKSMSFRMKAAQTIVSSIDSLKRITPHPKIILAGDFNDYEGDSILSYIEHGGMTNVTASSLGKNGAKASYKYLGEWRSIDHILVSDALRSKHRESYIYDDYYLLEEDKTFGGVMPKRTYMRYQYQNGYSDHLPVVATFGF